MQKVLRVSFRPRLPTLWEVLLASVFGICVLALLSFVTEGIAAAAVLILGSFALLGTGHYWLWGRNLSRQLKANPQFLPAPQILPTIPESAAVVPPEEFQLGLNEGERRELSAVLENALAADSATPAKDDEETNRRRELLERLRMYGA